MKKLYILLLLASYGTYAQCPAAGLTLSNQAQIDNIAVQYPTCTTITGDVIITGNNISNLNGLANITTITGALEIRNNPILTTLAGLQNITSVGTDVIIRNNSTLNSISALSGVTTVGGELTVRTNNSLISLNGLQGINTVGAGLIIRDNNLLADAGALQNVTSVGEILEFVENPLLTIIDMPNLANVTGGDEGALVIEANTVLQSLMNLGTSNTIFNGDVTIITNPLLTLCSAPSICNYLANPTAGAVITINTNAVGCNTQAQVEAGCTILGKGDLTHEVSLYVLENPVSNAITVQNSTGNSGTLTLYNSLGKLVMSHIIHSGTNTISAETLIHGIYIARLEAGGKTVSTKIIKQ
jgi:hypothetical protein